jgi:hypothetical protein
VKVFDGYYLWFFSKTIRKIFELAPAKLILAFTKDPSFVIKFAESVQYPLVGWLGCLKELLVYLQQYDKSHSSKILEAMLTSGPHAI